MSVCKVGDGRRKAHLEEERRERGLVLASCSPDEPLHAVARQALVVQLGVTRAESAARDHREQRLLGNVDRLSVGANGARHDAGDQLGQRDRDARQAPLLVPHPPLPLVPIQQGGLQLHHHVELGGRGTPGHDRSARRVEPHRARAGRPLECGGGPLFRRRRGTAFSHQADAARRAARIQWGRCGRGLREGREALFTAGSALASVTDSIIHRHQYIRLHRQPRWMRRLLRTRQQHPQRRVRETRMQSHDIHLLARLHQRRRTTHRVMQRSVLVREACNQVVHVQALEAAGLRVPIGGSETDDSTSESCSVRARLNDEPLCVPRSVNSLALGLRRSFHEVKERGMRFPRDEPRDVPKGVVGVPQSSVNI
eukprot:scaffold17913_cov112-Isochrysis_galbana.AAC.1